MKSRRIMAGAGFLAIAGGVAHFWWHLGDNRGFSPDQPIPFSHKLHAGDNKIPCQYCHYNADKSRYATVPSTNICMNCHKVVRTDSPLIQQVKEKYDKGEPLEWIKVHDMPDFVYFNHKRHIAKNIECQKCHGPVETMVQVEQVQKMEMGFCVECHRKEKASITCDTCHH